MLYKKINLKQALNHGLVLKKVHRVTKFDQNAWLTPYINLNTDLRKKQKMILKETFFSLMNNADFGKTMEYVRKHRAIQLVTIERRRNYLVSEPNYHTTKFFTEYLLAIEMKKTQILMNKTYLFRTSNTRIKYDEKAKLCYMDPDSFVL